MGPLESLNRNHTNEGGNDQSDFDIVIVGGGVVGCSLALALAKNNVLATSGKNYSLDNKKTNNSRKISPLKIALIEASPQALIQSKLEKTISSIDVGNTVHDFDPRVVALSQYSQTFFNDLGVWSKMTALNSCDYDAMHVWDGEGVGSIHFSAQQIQHKNLGCIVEQSVILSVLYTELKKYSEIEIFYDTQIVSYEASGKEGVNVSSSIIGSISPQYMTIETNHGDCFHTSLLIGADGPQSQMRALGNFDTRTWDYHQSAIVTTVETEKAHRHCAWQRFNSSGPLAFLPLHTKNDKANKFSSIVWSIERDKADNLMSLDHDEFCEMLSFAFEHKLGKVIQSAKRYSFPLHQRHVKSYIKKQFALIGDAAHVIHPLAGQGVNLGIADVDVLVQEILYARNRRIPLSDFSILKRYERKRQSHNLAAMAAMEFFKRSFASDNLPLRYIRNRALDFCDKQMWLKKVFMNVATGQM